MIKEKKRYELGANEIKEIVFDLHEMLINGGILLLKGNLASGKTTLVKELALSFDIKDKITSPTFSLMHRYGSSFFHYDLYQKNNDSLLQSGLFENLDQNGIHCVEWTNDSLENFLDNIGLLYIKISISPSKDIKKRVYEVENICKNTH